MKSSNLRKLGIGVVFLAFGFGCAPVGNYRVVKVTKGAGELAFAGDKAVAREKANAYMTEQCAGAYDIVEEGEAVIGENAHADRTFFGGVQSTSTQKTEWRIKFACKSGAATPVGGPAATPAATPPATRVSGQVHVIAIRY